MRIHPPVQTPTNEHTRFPIRQFEKRGAKEVASFGGEPTPKNQSPRLTHPLDEPLLIYDGICNLCTTATRFIHILDRRERFRYLPIQKLSRTIHGKYGLTETMLEGQMYLVRSDGSIVGGSFAIAEICKALCPFAFLCYATRIHRFQQLYSWVVSRRYTLFGCRDTCYVVHAGISHGTDD
jgi:predicted DCC family thiol-disulfide oxidoreductase YuxK